MSCRICFESAARSRGSPALLPRAWTVLTASCGSKLHHAVHAGGHGTMLSLDVHGVREYWEVFSGSCTQVQGRGRSCPQGHGSHNLVHLSAWLDRHPCCYVASAPQPPQPPQPCQPPPLPPLPRLLCFALASTRMVVSRAKMRYKEGLAKRLFGGENQVFRMFEAKRRFQKKKFRTFF